MVSMTGQELSAQSQAQDDDVVLSVSGVSKRFCRDLKRSLMYGMQDIASELIGLRGNKVDTLRPKEFWALKDVSFQLRRGEALGLVGKNGSGKSTLLRVIAGLIKPDTGSVDVRGRVAPLIALGAGFNPVLTGRENVYANMSILGLSKEEIDDRFDEVIEFAEIGEALDSPVQSYSSGMAARLGFATAIYTDPDILLIDEVLAVGDSRFQGKCFRKLHDLRKKNTAFILVSHNSHSILTVCETAIYLNKGKMLAGGDTALVMKQYEEELFFEAETAIDTRPKLIKPQLESSSFEISDICFRDTNGEIIEAPTSGETCCLCIQCDVHEAIDNVGLSAVVKGLADGGEIVLLLNNLSDKQPFSFIPGKHEVQLQFPHFGLRLGNYTIDIYAKKDGLYHLDSIESFRFKVLSKDSISRGLYYQPRNWKIVKK
jgi:lipopolysaccharide transport system ATP-binding protein